jgi:hypothetical protein
VGKDLSKQKIEVDFLENKSKYKNKSAEKYGQQKAQKKLNWNNFGLNRFGSEKTKPNRN